jgi:hypothetical protein
MRGFTLVLALFRLLRGNTGSPAGTARRGSYSLGVIRKESPVLGRRTRINHRHQAAGNPRIASPDVPAQKRVVRLLKSPRGDLVLRMPTAE